MVNSILDNYNIQYLEYLTPISNLASIVEHGILSHNVAHRSSLVEQDISDSDVQRRRSQKTVGNLSLHDYANLYFNARNPMLYRRIQVQDSIAILCVNRDYIGRSDVWYSDGNAASEETLFYSSLQDLNQLNWSCIWADYWRGYHDGRRIRCAEILVPFRVPFSEVKHVVVRTRQAQQDARRALPATMKVVFDPSRYFQS